MYQKTAADGTNDWRDQMNGRIMSLDDLKERLFPEMTITEEMRAAEKVFPVTTTPYYASLVKTADFNDPVFAQIVPRGDELRTPPWLVDDPLREKKFSPVPHLVHRYPDRALIVATSACASRCRHCTRKRVSASTRESAITTAEMEACCDYLQKNPAIDDVLVSGGDPLTLSDEKIDKILTAIVSVSSVKVVRIATRTLVNMPIRFTDSLVAILRRDKPVYVNTHFNHPVEITPGAIAATDKLTDAGIPVANQTVLLRGINDTPQIIEALCRELFHNRIRPYYLFQCDLVCGIEHLRTPLSTGFEIMKYLRGRLSGMAIPNFAVDTPGNGGKIELLPESIVRREGNATILVNFLGVEVAYPDP